MSIRTLDMLRQRNVPVYFDANNHEHIKAFEMQCLGEVGINGKNLRRTHPTLRFVLESPFLDMQTMMLHKIGRAYVQSQVNSIEPQLEVM